MRLACQIGTLNPSDVVVNYENLEVHHQMYTLRFASRRSFPLRRFSNDKRPEMAKDPKYAGVKGLNPDLMKVRE